MTPTPTRTVVAGVAAFGLAVIALLTWSKWAPYLLRTEELSASGAWSGSSLLATAGVEAGSGPSLAAGWAFTVAYGTAVWKAVVAGLVIAAGIQSLVPRGALLRLLRRGPWGSAARGGLVATPSMMCSCCTAPVANALQRSGVPTAGVVAYWLGNPLLNPAVLVFMLLVAPWQWAAVRLVVGVVLVVGGAVLVARLTRRRSPPGALAAVGADAQGPSHRGFFATLVRTALVIVPEYLVVVFVVGVFSGWLFPLGESARSWGVLALLVAVVLGTLMVIPTAGEIPFAQGLAVAGFGPAVVGALLIVLPAVSVPSAVMTGRALGWRVVGLTMLVVGAGGLLAGALLALTT
ncbi:permease [Kineococcus gynurae]|uniref:Permease n=1 Tax=Kineococcus gynurae TaxID=452979 RepID=A0ABV5LXN4_9ACTN